MRCPSRIAFPVLVGVVTLTVCSIGVRAELKIANDSIADHRHQAQLARQAAETKRASQDEQGPNVPPR
jgi:hypothetical protein